MTQPLLTAARRYADAHVDAFGVARTPFPGLVILRETMPTPLLYAISQPLVAMVLQGEKRVMLGATAYEFGAGDSLLITADTPNASQITRASAAAPYYSLVLELDPALIENLVTDMGTTPFAPGGPIRVDPTDTETADAALRLLTLLDRPAALPVLKDQFMRELHFWLLSGTHGGAIRALGVTDSHARRIGRAVAMLREQFATPLRVEQLAEAAGMSVSGFHLHFRNLTALSPLQFQKQLRLIEARRRLTAEGAAISQTAFDVGYESIPQFTREYGRFFGLPPARDVRETRARLMRVA